MVSPNNELTRHLRSYVQGSEFLDGYRGCYSDDVIQRIQRYGAPVGCVIEQHAHLPRCMERIRDMIDARQQGAPLACGTVVTAGRLLKGSGRFDRDWFAPEGGLWMAMAWADNLLPDIARLIPMAAGTASCEAIRAFGVRASVKWVNDIHVQGRKIGGILCETCLGKHPDDRYHLIGIGINCNNTAFPVELANQATSLINEGETAIDLERFTLELLARLTWNFGLLHLAEELLLHDNPGGSQENPVVEAWKKLSDTVGRRVLYGYDVINNPLYEGTVITVDDTGSIELRLDNGSAVTENSGEILYLS